MPATELLVAGLILSAIGTALIIVAPKGAPVPVPHRPAAGSAPGDDTPVTITLYEYPPEPDRMRGGRWTLLAGLGLIAVGLAARWL